MDNSFYDNFDYRTCEIAISKEKFPYLEKGKFYIPSLMPYTSKETIRLSTDKIINKKDNHSIPMSFETIDYIELYVPQYIGSIIKDDDDNIPSGTSFIVVFVGGDINKPRIVRLYSNE